jgi:2-polyprenyl-3-methyl-5-hydroxy-6-metoxy-1,4-benzoquinol methylase
MKTISHTVSGKEVQESNAWQDHADGFQYVGAKGEEVKIANSCPFCGSDAVKRFELVQTLVWTCKSGDCGLQFAKPQLDDEALAQAYTKHYYPTDRSVAGPTYENTPEEILRQTFSELTRRQGSLTGKTLLDFGCGAGRLCAIAQEYGLQTAGIEADACARGTASKATDLGIYENVEELQVRLPAKKFDIITMWDVIEHLREPWKDLQGLSGLLQSDGYLLVSTPNAGCLRARVEKERWDNTTNPTHFYYFIRKSLRSVLQRSGFSDVAELRFAVRYPSHSAIRYQFHRALLTCHLQGELLFVARVGKLPRR